MDSFGDEGTRGSHADAPEPWTARPCIGLSVGRLPGDGRLLDAVSHEYAGAIVEAGGVPLIFPVVPPELAPTLVASMEGLVLTGGGDVAPGCYGAVRAPETAGVDPDRDAMELALVADARTHGVPILGVCRGMQLLNVALGGTLHQDLAGGARPRLHFFKDRRDEPVHRVSLVDGSTLASITGRDSLRVNSVHHQGIAELAQSLVPIAFAGDELVEAVEDRVAGLLGVQWHPELILDEPGSRELFSWFVSLVATRASVGAS